MLSYGRTPAFKCYFLRPLPQFVPWSSWNKEYNFTGKSIKKRENWSVYFSEWCLYQQALMLNPNQLHCFHIYLLASLNWLRGSFLNPIWPRGGTLCRPVTYLRISVQIRVRAHWKNLTFLGYEFGKGQYTFYPLKLSCFAEKNKVRRKYQNFIRDPYKLGQTPLWRTKVSKVKNFFGGFWASKLHESFWIWKLITARQVISKKN